MAELEPEMPIWQNVTISQQSPRLSCRIKLDKTSRGWNSESTVAVEGELTVEEVRELMLPLLHETDAMIRAEIVRRERLDQEYRSGPVGRLELAVNTHPKTEE